MERLDVSEKFNQSRTLDFVGRIKRAEPPVNKAMKDLHFFRGCLRVNASRDGVAFGTRSTWYTSIAL